MASEYGKAKSQKKELVGAIPQERQTTELGVQGFTETRKIDQ